MARTVSGGEVLEQAKAAHRRPKRSGGAAGGGGRVRLRIEAIYGANCPDYVPRVGRVSFRPALSVMAASWNASRGLEETSPADIDWQRQAKCRSLLMFRHEARFGRIGDISACWRPNPSGRFAKHGDTGIYLYGRLTHMPAISGLDSVLTPDSAAH